MLVGGDGHPRGGLDQEERLIMAFEFDNRVSLGHLITVGALAVTVALAWGDVKTRTESLTEKAALSSTTLTAHETRIRAMEQASARQDERMSLILDGLRKIDTKLERLEARP